MKDCIIFAVIWTASLPLISIPLQVRSQISQASAPTAATPAPSDYTLHVNDALEVQFPFSPEYNESVTVQPDGQIRLRETQAMSVAGRTVATVRDEIVASYKSILRDPTVTILLKNFLSPSFYASGEVGRPGRYELRNETTLLQALAESGGLINERSKTTRVVIFRPHGNAEYESHVVNVKDLLKPKGRFEDHLIYPGDIIYVPQNRFSKFQRYIPSASMATAAPAF